MGFLEHIPVAVIIGKDANGLVSEGIEIPLYLVEIKQEFDRMVRMKRYTFTLESEPTNRDLITDMDLTTTSYGSLTPRYPITCKLIITPGGNQ